MQEHRGENTINTMREILVATDGSPAAEAALEEALALAAQTGNGIAVITVWRALQGDFGLAYPPTAVLPDILDAERAHAEASLSAAASRAAASGVEIVTRLATGDPAEAICAFADEIDATMIAVGTRGHGTVASLLLGSVSQAVVRHAPSPVLVVRDPARAGGAQSTVDDAAAERHPQFPMAAVRPDHDAAEHAPADDRVGSPIEHGGEPA